MIQSPFELEVAQHLQVLVEEVLAHLAHLAHLVLHLRAVDEMVLQKW